MMDSGAAPALLLLSNGLDIGQKHGGAEIFTAELALNLCRRDWRVLLGLMVQTGSSVEQEWQQRLERAAVRCCYLNPGGGHNLISSLRQAERLCREEQVGFIHSHAQTGSLVALGLKWGDHRRRTLRTVHTPYEWGPSLPGWFLRHLFSRWFFPLGLDAQVAVSRAIQAQVNHYPGTRLAHKTALFIPNGLSDTWFQMAPGPRRPPEKWPIIATVGVLQPNKGQRYLISAFRDLLPAYPQAELWLIGDGPERKNLEALTRQLSITERVHFWGQRGNLPDWFAQMDVFVLPSLVEGLSTVVLESMASRVPVIAADIPGNHELIEPGVTGWLVPPRDVTAISAALQEVLAAPIRSREMVMTALERIQPFRMSVIAQQYERLYQQDHLHKTG